MTYKINKKYDNIFLDYQLPKDIILGATKTSINCFRCKIGVIKKIDGKYYGFCDYCPDNSSYYCFWEPMPHQKIVLQLNTKWIFNFGAVGTGKTDASCAKIFRHLIEVENAYVLVIAHDLTTAIDVVNRSLMKFLPMESINNVDGQARKEKTKFKLTLKNGSELQIFPSQNPESYRGRNATLAYVIEANKIKKSVVEELIGRIRNEDQMVFELDNNGDFIFEKDQYGILRKKTIWEFGQILIESNPDEASWIFKDGLLKCKTIFWSYHVGEKKGVKDYKNIDVKKDVNKAAVISATIDNKYVGKSFIEGLEHLSPVDRRKLMFGEFIIDGSPVWPNIKYQEVKNAKHEQNWFHGLGADWGNTTDPVCFIHWFLDPYREKIVVWKCEYIFGKSILKIGTHLKNYFQKFNYLNDKRVLDPSAWNKTATYYVDGGDSPGQQLNRSPLFCRLIKAINDIKRGENSLEQLINADLIEFDTTGEGVLSLLEDLSRVHYPKANDNTKRGENKSIARVVTDNHKYDTIRYIACSIDELWIKQKSEYYKSNYKESSFYNKRQSLANHALDLDKDKLSTKQFGINYGKWLMNDEEE